MGFITIGVMRQITVMVMGFAPTIPWDREELDLNMPYKEG